MQRVAFISGGTSGINLGIAKHYAAQGGKVLVFGRDPEKADRAAAEIRAETSSEAMPGVADVRDPGAVAELFSRAAGDLGRPDLIVAGAAGNFMAPASRLSPNGFKAVVEIDLIGTFNVFSAGLNHIRTPGSMVAISAPQATLPMFSQAHVCAAKAGVNMLVKVLAMEWGSRGIRVNAVSPGPIQGTLGVERMAVDEASKRDWSRRLALGRFGKVHEIAELVAFIASDAGSYITGTILECDGGMSLGDASSAHFEGDEGEVTATAASPTLP